MTRQAGEIAPTPSVRDAAAEAAEASRCRDAARAARELAARVLADAQAEAAARAAEILADAQAEAGQLTARADAADADAAWHELQAMLIPQQDAAEAGLEAIAARRADLEAAGEAAAAALEDAQARLAALAARQARQRQRRDAAARDGNVDAIRAAQAEETAIGEAQAGLSARLSAAQSALAAAEAGLGQLDSAETQARDLLAELDRQAAGMPPSSRQLDLARRILGEADLRRGTCGQDAADALLSWCPPQPALGLDLTGPLARLIPAPVRAQRCAQLLDDLWERDPDRYDALAAQWAGGGMPPRPPVPVLPAGRGAAR